MVNQKMNKKFYLALSVFAMSLLVGGSMLLLGAPIISDNPKTGADSKNFDPNGSLRTAGNFDDDPIEINGNWNFSDYSDEGTGDAGEPYIIEDLRINPTTNGTPGILIKDTDAHFKIENVTVIGAIPDDYSGDVGGFYLENVTNGGLVNCNATENHIGFWLKNSTNNTLSNNFAEGNTVGFRLSDSSNDNNLSSNIADNNNYGTTEGAGFTIENSHENALNNNTATKNDVGGITLTNSQNNTLINNTANNNGYGFLLTESDDNDLVNNTANKNNDGSSAGFHLTGENNNLTNNIANENEGHGIYLTDANQTIIKDNTANENKKYGISLKLSSYNTITENTFKYNEDGCTEEGYRCEGNIFDNNICEDPEDPGDSEDDAIPGYPIMIIIGITTIVFSFLLARQKEMA